MSNAATNLTEQTEALSVELAPGQPANAQEVSAAELIAAARKAGLRAYEDARTAYLFARKYDLDAGMQEWSEAFGDWAFRVPVVVAADSQLETRLCRAFRDGWQYGVDGE